MSASEDLSGGVPSGVRVPLRSSPRSSFHRQGQIYQSSSILDDISPDLILEALVSTSSISPPYFNSRDSSAQDSQEFIRHAVASASSSERVWGIKAAKASKKIGGWYTELQGWTWEANTYGAAGTLAQSERLQAAHSIGHTGEEVGQYGAALSTEELHERESRIKIITAEMQTLDLDEMKTLVREAHGNSSKRSLSSSTGDYEHMNDFTALITATLVQMLPRLAKLNAMLNVWSIRLLVLKEVPVFLAGLYDCRESMVSAKLALDSSRASSPSKRTSFTPKVFGDMEAVLRDQVSRQGQRLDTMLDIVEGSSETLPEAWIDGVEELESDLGAWLVQAEHLILRRELEDERSREASSDQHVIETTGPRAAQDNDMPVMESSTSPSMKIGVETESAAAHVGSDPLPVPGPSPRSQTEPLAGSTQATSILSPHQSDDTVARTEDETEGSNDPINPIVSYRGTERIARHNSISTLALGTLTPQSGSAASDYDSDEAEIYDVTIARYQGSPVKVTSPSRTKLPKNLPNGLLRKPNSYEQIRAHRKSWKSVPSVVPLSPVTSQPQRNRQSTCIPEDLASSLEDIPPPTLSQSVPSLNSSPSTDASTQSLAGILRSASFEKTTNIPEPSATYLHCKSMDEDKLSSDLIAEPILPHDYHTTLLKPLKFPPDDSETQDGIDFLQAKGEDAEKSIREENIQAGFANTSSQLPIPRSSKKSAPGEQRFPNQTTAAACQEFHPAGSVVLSSAEVPHDPLKSTATKMPAAGHPNRLEEQIHSILTAIPADIRLESSVETNVSPKLPLQKDRISMPRRVSIPRLLRSKPSTSSPSMTLSLAPQESKRRLDSDIKLYHLHQTGHEAPIKLYIRSVGEAGERVMVRIGGGWADLGEYLKEYASHHGKRSISDGSFAIQALESSPAVSSASSKSRPASPSSSKRPSTAKATKQSIWSSPMNMSSSPCTPPESVYRSDMCDSPAVSIGEKDSPSLAGLRKKKINISPRKQAWVDGMMRRARQTSYGQDSKRDVNVLGKSGGVKKVFLRDKE